MGMSLSFRVVNVAVTVLVDRQIACIAKHNFICLFIVIVSADEALIIMVILNNLTCSLEMQRYSLHFQLNEIV